MEPHGQARQSLRTMLSAILRLKRYRLVLFAGILGYWVLYVVSGGWFERVPVDGWQVLRELGLPNPYFVTHIEPDLTEILYDNGMLWMPTPRMQVTVLFGPLLFSIILSLLFALNLVVLIYGVQMRGLKGKSGITSALSVVPAFFSGGCCAVPMGSYFLTAFLPSLIAATLVHRIPYVTNTAIVIVLIVSLIYYSRRIGPYSNSTCYFHRRLLT